MAYDYPVTAASGCRRGVFRVRIRRVAPQEGRPPPAEIIQASEIFYRAIRNKYISHRPNAAASLRARVSSAAEVEVVGNGCAAVLPAVSRPHSRRLLRAVFGPL